MKEQVEVPADEPEVTLDDVKNDEGAYRGAPLTEEQRAEAEDRLRRYLGLPPGTKFNFATIRGGYCLPSKNDPKYDPADDQLFGTISVPGGEHPVLFSVPFPPSRSFRLGSGILVLEPRKNRPIVAKVVKALSKHPDQRGSSLLPLRAIDSVRDEMLLVTSAGDNQPARAYVLVPGWKVEPAEWIVLGTIRPKSSSARWTFVVDPQGKRYRAIVDDSHMAQERNVPAVFDSSPRGVRLEVEGLGTVDIPGSAGSGKILVNGQES
jgi:hypothetical protein